jgi:predicted transcriptional regulator
MTALYRLDQKGLVSRRRDGNADVYRARLSRAAHTQAQAKARTDALVDQFGDVAYIAMARRIAHEHRDALRA